MSATIEEIQEFIGRDHDGMRFKRTKWFGVLSNKPDLGCFIRSHTYMYPENSSLNYTDVYDYIDIKVLMNRKGIVDLVIDGDKKWLIFVDSKEFGRSLRKDILNAASQTETLEGPEDVVFITSDYDLDSEGSREVNAIVSRNKQTAKVLIVTSVLDNGISINLYIFRQTKSYFLKRQRSNSKKLEIAYHYHEKIVQLLEERVIKSNFIEEVDRKEKEIIESQHKLLMQYIMEDVTNFENVRASFLVIEGVLYLNLLSFWNLENINKFYCRLLLEFESYGEDAFLREQLCWLGKTGEEADLIINEAKKSQFKKSQQQVIAAFNEIVDKPLTEHDFISLKLEIRNALLVLVESVDENNVDRKKYIDAVKKNDRVISKPFMEFIARNCGIPYSLEKENCCYIVKAVKN